MCMHDDKTRHRFGSCVCMLIKQRHRFGWCVCMLCEVCRNVWKYFPSVCEDGMWSLSTCLRITFIVANWLVSGLCKVPWNDWDEYSSERFCMWAHAFGNSDLWVCSVKVVDMFQNITHSSDSDVCACSVKILEMFENNINWSDCEILVCSVKFVEMFREW